MTIDSPAPPQRSYLVTLLACFALTLVGGIFLYRSGMPTDQITGFLTGITAIVTALLLNLKHTAAQTPIIAKIDAQTNGGLTARIRSEATAIVRAELDKPIPLRPAHGA